MYLSHPKGKGDKSVNDQKSLIRAAVDMMAVTDEMVSSRLKLDKEVGKRLPFVQRSRKGKTARKRALPSTGTKTNVGDPCKGNSSQGKK